MNGCTSLLRCTCFGRKPSPCPPCNVASHEHELAAIQTTHSNHVLRTERTVGVSNHLPNEFVMLHGVRYKPQQRCDPATVAHTTTIVAQQTMCANFA